MERKLASIRVVSNIQPIVGADAIECLTIDGWKVVAKKGEFSVGDQCVYFEIDSFLPICDEFEFLRKSSFRSHPTLGDGFRLRTVKLRGQVSQGLAIPVNDLFDGTPFPVGCDVTEFLEVQKYEAPIPTELAGQVEGPFPSFIHKTDQERAQNLVLEIDEHSNDDFEMTMKLDGASCTIFVNDGNVGICSRNYQLKINDENKDNTFIRTATNTGLFKALSEYKRNIAVQAELMGPGVQGNREKFTEHRLFMFDVFDIDKQRYVSAHDREAILNDLNQLGAGLFHVPVLSARAKLRSTGIEDLLVLAEGASINHEIREGVVFKSIQHADFSFKVISNRFLLKCEE